MADQPAAGRRRAARLLVGGLIGGHLGALLAIGISVAGGRYAVASAAIAAAVTIAFFTIGQAVQVGLAESSATAVLIGSLASYFLRVGVLGLVVLLALQSPALAAWLNPFAVVGATIAVVVGWLTGEITVFRRLRIPVYDSNE